MDMHQRDRDQTNEDTHQQTNAQPDKLYVC